MKIEQKVAIVAGVLTVATYFLGDFQSAISTAVTGYKNIERYFGDVEVRAFVFYSIFFFSVYFSGVWLTKRFSGEAEGGVDSKQEDESAIVLAQNELISTFKYKIQKLRSYRDSLLKYGHRLSHRSRDFNIKLELVTKKFQNIFFEGCTDTNYQGFYDITFKQFTSEVFDLQSSYYNKTVHSLARSINGYFISEWPKSKVEVRVYLTVFNGTDSAPEEATGSDRSRKLLLSSGVLEVSYIDPISWGGLRNVVSPDDLRFRVTNDLAFCDLAVGRSSFVFEDLNSPINFERKAKNSLEKGFDIRIVMPIKFGSMHTAAVETDDKLFYGYLVALVKSEHSQEILKMDRPSLVDLVASYSDSLTLSLKKMHESQAVLDTYCKDRIQRVLCVERTSDKAKG